MSHASRSNQSRRVAGFTLIELLMVITIIGLLAGLITTVAFYAIQKAKVARVVLELNQLDLAMQTYRNEKGEYPPNMGQVLTTSGTFDTAERAARFTRHVRKAFPRSTQNYAALVTAMNTKRDPGAVNYEYTYKTESGNLDYLQLDTLDQAEALVFWLGGFPTPWDSKTTAAIAPRKLFGFHKDPQLPWKRDPRSEEAPRPLDFRSPILFQFDEARLVDTDNDGWLEYVPPLGNVSSDAKIPPYVYFDAASYVTVNASGVITHDAYPSSLNAELRALWGLAVPYALFFDPNKQSPTRWVNPESFQIICAGLDGYYGAPTSETGLSGMRVPVFPSGFTYRESDSFSQQSYYDPEEVDNLTSFTKGPLKDAAEGGN